MYEHFEHTADLGLRARAASLEEVLAEMGMALSSAIVANLDAVRPLQEERFAVAGDDEEDLLIDWLAELLYTFETRRLVFSRFAVKRTAEGIEAVAHGERLDPPRHEPNNDVKAITYHGLRLEREAESYLAEVIVDL